MAEKGALLSTVGQKPRISPDAPSDAAIVLSACAVPCTLTSGLSTLCIVAALRSGLLVRLLHDSSSKAWWLSTHHDFWFTLYLMLDALTYSILVLTTVTGQVTADAMPLEMPPEKNA